MGAGDASVALDIMDAEVGYITEDELNESEDDLDYSILEFRKISLSLL